MAGQDQQRSGSRRTETESDDVAVAPVSQTPRQTSGAEVDDLLDEIDSVLEENSEEFVRGFVQKGGQ